ncbi:MAG TPA: hypothetical protein VF629_13625 [Hymenobacter sp.]|jgi:hypothetical protein|uniref:hypothetical protein n=1 Tax=Hymenobacter sp. TaxID=1898978 RepID=UPI002ED98133
MNWEELKKYVYYTDGSLRDIYVADTTREDWKIWAEYVNSSYRVVSSTELGNDDEKVAFTAVMKYWDSNNEQSSMPLATISVGALCLECFFFTADEIQNTVNPKYINSIDDHNQLIKFMTDLSYLLDKDVKLIIEEDIRNNSLITVSKDIIEINPYYQHCDNKD